MGKPRLFIGSSVEGLSVAYAIQENLRFVSEVTVWDQGVFNLSESSLESLLSMLETCEFGIFVFTPDDHIKIRGKKDLAVRDNVLFELGLFIGKLGRKRSFIVIPDNKIFHLPTDLIGVTPAKYETSRSDSNLQAATGSASNKIREAITKISNARQTNIEPEEKPESEPVPERNETDIQIMGLIHSKEFDKATTKLRKIIRYSKDIDKKVHYKSLLCYIEYQKEQSRGRTFFENLIEEYPTNNIPYKVYANALYFDSLYTDALKKAEKGLESSERKVGLTIIKSKCLWELNEKIQAISYLEESIKLVEDPSLYVELSALFTQMGESRKALEVTFKGFLKYPKNEEILNEFAKKSFAIGQLELSVMLYNKLINLKSDNSEYWTFLANSYYGLELYNKSLVCYEKGNTLAKEKEAWILSNIGNLYYAKGLYHKAELFLKKAIEMDNVNEYSHDRIADTYGKIEEEEKKIEEIIKVANNKIAGNKLNF